jgi:hypothetical protein
MSDSPLHVSLERLPPSSACGEVCSVGNTNCLSSDRDSCFAYWANADSYAGGNGATVASDVCFSSVIGANGSNAGVGGNGDISAPHEDGAQIALCDGTVRYYLQTASTREF